MKTKAAVLVETGKPLIIADIDVPVLKAGQVLVDVAFSGVCHTQILECRGHRGKDNYLPHCLGHEGSGVVREIGPGVNKVKPGDEVILSWMKGSGADVPCTLYSLDGNVVNSGAITTFGKQSVISENRLTVIEGGIPLKDAAMLGCAVATGLGAVFNKAQPRPGQSIAVFGTGGIGLCAVMGADISGCAPVIAVDVSVDKLKVAKRLGATHCIDASKQDVVGEIKKICPGGLDFAIESSGVPKVMLDAVCSVRHQGGTAVVVGNAHHGQKLDLDPKELNMGKNILGTWGGDNVPDRDFPRYMNLLKSGKLDLEPFLAKTYTLDQVNYAIDDLEAGRVVRPIIDMEYKG